MNSSSTANKRRRKAVEALSIQDASLSMTFDEPKTRTRSRKAPQKATKTPKLTKIKKSDKQNNSLVTEDESFDTKSGNEERQVSEIDHLMTEDEENSKEKI